MYKVLDNKIGAKEHFKDYAEKVRLEVESYLASKTADYRNTFVGSFLENIASSDTTSVGSGSLLEQLLIGDFQQQKVLIHEIYSDLKNEETIIPGTIANFNEVMNHLFVKKIYENSYFFIKDKHIERVGIEVCPYCGRNYIFSVAKRTKTNPNTRVKPQIDHFLPKTDYPYLALNYYNLIPSCTLCNMSPCKWTNDPIGIDHSHEYLMQPYEFRKEDIVFGYIPTTSIYKDFSVSIIMDCKKRELEEGYKGWLVLDKLYGKHNGVVTRMFVQLDSIVAREYKKYLKNKFKVPLPFLEEMPKMMFGYDLDDSQAPFIALHKFKKDIFNQIKKDVGDFSSI